MSYLTDGEKGRLAACLSRYHEAAALTHVPWWLLAGMHYLESEFAESAGQNTAMQLVDLMQSPNFLDKIKGYARRVGLTDLPDPRTNLKSALIICGLFLQDKVRGSLTEQSTQAEANYAAYLYNGAGYHDINLSPYVFSDPQNGHPLTVHERGPNGPINVVFKKAGIAVICPEIRGEDNAPTVAAPKGTVYYPLAHWGSTRIDPDYGRFLAPRYNQWRIDNNLGSAEHTGADVNTGGSGDADLGTPIFAMASGVVKYSFFEPKVWGNIVVIDHPQFAVASMYAHLQANFVRQGEVIEAGAQIGTMGKGAPKADGSYRFLSHLHCEIRRNRNLSAGNWPGGTPAAKASIERDYIDPEKWWRAVGAKDIAGAPDPLIESLVKVKDSLTDFVRKQMPGYRLEVTRIGWPPLAAQAATTAQGSKTNAAYRNPHTMRPSLAFDFRLVRAGSGVAISDPEYAKVGNEAIRLGAAWGPNVNGGVIGEPGSLRNHIEVKNATEAINKQLKNTVAGLAPAGQVDAYLASIGSDPNPEVNTRGSACSSSVS
jgi:murein DD-endopeptidase MepM/ murein hydrolase activator NlpD